MLVRSWDALPGASWRRHGVTSESEEVGARWRGWHRVMAPRSDWWS
jgi:hypothetical protein